jgi:SurA N-terminal domain
MIRSLRKYQQGFLWVAAIVVITSLLAFFKPGQFSSQGGGLRSYGTMYGKPLKAEQVQEASRQAKLAAIVRFGGEDTQEARRARFNLEQETLQRLLLRKKIDDLGIRVEDADVANWIRENLKDPKTGVLNYNAFIERVLRPKDFTSTEFEEYIRQDLALKHLIEVIGVGASLVTPREAEGEFRRENEQARASVVVFSATNHLSGIKLDATSLGQFFTNQLPNYRIPERRTVTYVRWESSNFLARAEAQLAQITGLPARLEQFYQERGADSFKDNQGIVMTKEAALAMIRQQTALVEAGKFAQASARDFANELYSIEPVKPENLAQLASKKGLTVGTSAPFSENGVASGLEDFSTLGRETFKLTTEQPFTTPVSGSLGTLVAALATRLPSEVPALAAIESRVREDKTRFDSREAARNAGLAFSLMSTNELAQGKSFAQIAAVAKLTPIELAPFSLSSETIPGLNPGLNPTQVKDAVFNLKPGTSSRFIATFDGGFVVYLQSIQPVDDALVKSGLNAYVEEVRQRRRQETIEAWVRNEFQVSGLAARMKDRGAN